MTRALKYSLVRRYKPFSLSIREFYFGLEHELNLQGFSKVGVQMGLGLTFAQQGTSVWGAVIGEVRNESVRVFVSVVNRKIALLAVIIGLGLALPYFVSLLVAGKLGIISADLFVAFALSFIAVELTLAYEVTSGIFPSSRRVRRELMLACDTIAERAGAKPLGKFEVMGRYLEADRRKPLRLWKWRPWPEMVEEDELLQQPVPG